MVLTQGEQRAEAAMALCSVAYKEMNQNGSLFSDNRLPLSWYSSDSLLSFRFVRIYQVSNSGQSAIASVCTFSAMEDRVRLLAVELDGDDGLVVTFSDGTIGAYVAEELLELRPYRERSRNRKVHNVPAEGPTYDNPGGTAYGADCR